jgi:hypothetical protein
MVLLLTRFREVNQLELVDNPGTGIDLNSGNLLNSALYAFLLPLFLFVDTRKYLPVIKSSFLHFWALNVIYTCFVDYNMYSDIDWRLQCSKHMHINRNTILKVTPIIVTMTKRTSYIGQHALSGHQLGIDSPRALEVELSSLMTKIFKILET